MSLEEAEKIIKEIADKMRNKMTVEEIDMFGRIVFEEINSNTNMTSDERKLQNCLETFTLLLKQEIIDNNNIFEYLVKQ